MTTVPTLAVWAIWSWSWASVRSLRAWSGSSVTRSIPGPVTLARSARAWSSAFWPALTELMACCGVLPPKA